MSSKYIQQQHLPFSQDYCLFHTPTNQCFVCSLVIQPLALHLTTILLGSCSLDIVAWFIITHGDNLPASAHTISVPVTWLYVAWRFHHHLRIMYGDNLLPSASTVSWQLLPSLCCQTFSSPPVLQLVDSIIWGHIEAHWIFIGVSYLAHNVIGHLSRPGICCWKQQVPPWSLLAVSS